LSRGPVPTRVTYDLKTTITSFTLVGPTPTSAHIPEAVTSFEVTKGYVPCHKERKVPCVPSMSTCSLQKDMFRAIKKEKFLVYLQ